MSTATKTYGEIRLKGDRWEISCEPHVLIRLKRLFAGAAKQAGGRLRLSDTPETCADLEWALVRYPMIVHDPDDLRTHAQDHRDRISAVDAMLSRRRPPPEFDLALPPREYQRIAAGIALQTGGLLLADEVGLGKTVVGICMLADPRTLPALVVTLTHLPPQWVRELQRFAPKLEVHVLKKATPYDLTEGRSRRAGGQLQLGLPKRFPDVIISNYHKLAGWAPTLCPPRREALIRSVIFDECQELRHDDTERYRAARILTDAVEYRLGCSATPIFNYGAEFHTVANILRPGALGSKTEFQSEWCGGYDESGKIKIRDPKAFGTYVRDAGIMLRRTRADVGRELPPLTKIPHAIDANKEALSRIENSAAELARILLAQNERQRGDKMLAGGQLDALMREATGIAKAPFVADFVRILVESGERVVLYGWHHAVYEIWASKLEDLKPAFYTGRESVPQKEAARESFLAGESRILVMSLRAGAGLDGLQAVCRTVVHGELDWSPAVHAQADGRVNRDGQAHPVMAYYLVADSGSDPIVADVLGVKRGQSEGILDPNAALVENLSVDPDHIKKLARSFLEQRGETPAEAAPGREDSSAISAIERVSA